MDYEKITIEAHGDVAIITLNDPAVRNALSPVMLKELSKAVNIIAVSKEARCLLIKGEGAGFCSGANLSVGMDSSEGPPRFSRSLREYYHPLLLGLRDLEIPIVSAVHGPAAGAGVGIALCGDIICASKDAYFLQAFGRIGLAPDAGTTYSLPRLVGWGRALEMSMLADKVPAEQAYEWGLINRLYDDHEALMNGALGLAERLATGPKSLGLMRRLFNGTWENDFAAQLELEAQVQDLAGATDDAMEGMTAFLEKRPAKFKGQ